MKMSKDYKYEYKSDSIGLSKIISDVKKKLFETFLEKLKALDELANHDRINPFTCLVWVRNSIKSEIKIYKKLLEK